jgi:hypothetical protein
MDKLLKLLGIDKLNEDTQAEVKQKLNDYIDVKVKEDVATKLSEEKDALVEKYEEKFEEYKEDITSKFSNFVDSILDEELTIPEKVLEFAKKGELYTDLIEQFKIRLSVDEGLLDDEVKGLLKEAKEEILSLRKDMDKLTEQNLTLKGDAQEMAASLYLHEKMKGLTEEQKSHVLSILEGVTSKEEIDRKFKIVLESLDIKINEEDDEDEDEDDDKKKKDEDDDKEDEEDEDKKNEGHFEVKDNKKSLNEDDDSPFTQFKNQYLKVLKENKI